MLAVPLATVAQETPQDKFFKARVMEVLSQQETSLPDGTVVQQQQLKLSGLEGEMAGQEFVFDGIGKFDAIKKNLYQVGDKVLAVASYDDVGSVNYYITDYVRGQSLLWLAVVFVLAIVIIGGFKGFRSLLSLAITFLILIKYTVPQIVGGANPLSVTLLSSFVILFIIIYLTEGFKGRSHVAFISVSLSLIITVFLSWLFVGLTKLSGLASEEISFLVNIGGEMINFKGLLLAGIIIGALGVLDDVVISQVATVEQIFKTDKALSAFRLFKKAYRVGVSHISSMTNTLFLAYVGVSLPLLVLLVSGQSAFNSYGQFVNNEAIATEIVRTLAGSIGIILAVPIATALAVWWFKAKA